LIYFKNTVDPLQLTSPYLSDCLKLKKLRVVAHEDNLDHYLVLANGWVNPLERKSSLNKFG
jgi:hypothetical protein